MGEYPKISIFSVFEGTPCYGKKRAGGGGPVPNPSRSRREPVQNLSRTLPEPVSKPYLIKTLLVEFGEILYLLEGGLRYRRHLQNASAQSRRCSLQTTGARAKNRRNARKEERRKRKRTNEQSETKRNEQTSDETPPHETKQEKRDQNRNRGN